MVVPPSDKDKEDDVGVDGSRGCCCWEGDVATLSYEECCIAALPRLSTIVLTLLQTLENKPELGSDIVAIVNILVPINA